MAGVHKLQGPSCASSASQVRLWVEPTNVQPTTANKTCQRGTDEIDLVEMNMQSSSQLGKIIGVGLSKASRLAGPTDNGIAFEEEQEHACFGTLTFKILTTKLMHAHACASSMH